MSWWHHILHPSYSRPRSASISSWSRALNRQSAANQLEWNGVWKWVWFSELVSIISVWRLSGRKSSACAGWMTVYKRVLSLVGAFAFLLTGIIPLFLVVPFYSFHSPLQFLIYWPAALFRVIQLLALDLFETRELLPSFANDFELRARPKSVSAPLVSTIVKAGCITQWSSCQRRSQKHFIFMLDRAYTSYRTRQHSIRFFPILQSAVPSL
jgi:hypothetical protein